MKKYMIIALCTITTVSGMEQQVIKREPREWDAELYAKGNKVQYESAFNFLKKNNITINNKHILDVGCGTGEISATLAQQACSVHGFDASKNMVQYAQQKHLHNNLSFEQSFAENFSSEKQYDLATIFFCFHWLFDKQQALKQISQHIKLNGELFGTFPASDDPHPARFTIATQMITELYPDCSLTEKLDRSEPTLQELHEILADVGFAIITSEQQTSNVILPDRKALEDFQRPVAMSRPFLQQMSLEERENFFTEFINRSISIMETTEDNKLIEKVTTRIIHARKVK